MSKRLPIECFVQIRFCKNVTTFALFLKKISQNKNIIHITSNNNTYHFVSDNVFNNHNKYNDSNNHTHTLQDHYMLGFQIWYCSHIIHLMHLHHGPWTGSSCRQLVVKHDSDQLRLAHACPSCGWIKKTVLFQCLGVIWDKHACSYLYKDNQCIKD